MDLSVHKNISRAGNINWFKMSVVMNLPCGHVSAEGNGDRFCPVCDDSTEEEIDISSCVYTTNTLKCSEEFCSGKRTTFFFPCLCHPFCNSCAEDHFARQKTGFEKCFSCHEPIENIYEMHMPVSGTIVVGVVE